MVTNLLGRRMAAALSVLLLALAASACGGGPAPGPSSAATSPSPTPPPATTPPPAASLDDAPPAATSAPDGTVAEPRWLAEPMTCTSLAGGLPGTIPYAGMNAGSIIPAGVTSADVCALSGDADVVRPDVPAAELQAVLDRIAALPTSEQAPCPATAEGPVIQDGLILRNARGQTYPIFLDANPLDGDPRCGLVWSPAGVRVLGPDLTINLAIEQIAAATTSGPESTNRDAITTVPPLPWGTAVDDAIRAVRAAGLIVRIGAAPGFSSLSGVQVGNTRPRSGRVVPTGTTVELILTNTGMISPSCSDDAAIPAPYVSGLDLATALDALDRVRVGWDVAGGLPALPHGASVDSYLEAFTVTAQEPAPGAPVETECAWPSVHLTVALTDR